MLTKRIRKSSEILLGLSLSIRKPYGLDRLVASGLSWSKAEELESQSSWNPKSLWDKSLCCRELILQHCQCQAVARNPVAYSLRR